MNNKSLIEAICGGFIGLGMYLCGLDWQIIEIWIILMAVDIIMGVIKACMNGRFSSKKMKIGLVHKCAELLVFLSVVLIMEVVHLNGYETPVSLVIVSAFCLKELGSIIENAVQINPKIVPSPVKRMIDIWNIELNNDEKNTTKMRRKK